MGFGLLCICWDSGSKATAITCVHGTQKLLVVSQSTETQAQGTEHEANTAEEVDKQGDAQKNFVDELTAEEANRLQILQHKRLQFKLTHSFDDFLWCRKAEEEKQEMIDVARKPNYDSSDD